MSLIENLPRFGRPRLPRADGLVPWIMPLAIIVVWQAACVTGFVSSRVNILTADQLDIAERFAGKGGLTGAERFAGAQWTTGPSGVPLLSSATPMPS